MKLSPKGPPPDRARSVLYGLDQSGEKPIETSLKQSSVAKLPALKQASSNREGHGFQNLRLSKGILKEISQDKYATKQQQLRDIQQ